MQITSPRARTARLPLALLALTLAAGAACAADAANAANATNATNAIRGIEQALAAAQQDKRGITVYVAGQAIGGAVTRIEPGQWVEMKSQVASKIIVRLDRIDGIATP